ncbi:MAG: lysylphosphatidylglycerol synthase domain-containing protein [Nocardioidaceae bacterium]
MAENGSEHTRIPHVGSRRPGRYARLRLSIGRHPADLARMVVSAAIVLACLVPAVTPGINPVESSIFSELERLPTWSTDAWRVLTWWGSWPGIVAVAGIALYLGRVRMGVSLAASGAAGWVLALVMHWMTSPRPMPADLLPTVLRHPAGGFDFPSVHVAVAAALATAASPYLARLTRESMWVLVVLVATADIFLGHNLPLGVFAGAALGWGTGTVLHLVLGAPGRRTSELSILHALSQAGYDEPAIANAHRRWLRPLELDVVTGAGQELQVKVVRRMHRSAGPLYKLRRLLASLEVEHEPGLSTPRHEVEHEAYITLLAERAGVGTLPVLLAAEIEHGPPFLIRRHVEGRLLAELAEDEVSDAVLDELWGNVVSLGNQHITHHDLRATNILIDDHGRPRIIDFTFSRIGGPEDQSAQDVAELLVSMASVVGVARAVEAAVRSLPSERLEKALPHLQWLVVHRRLRQQVDNDHFTLTDLRESLAERIGAEVPSFRSPVRPATLVLLLAGGLAVYLLLPQLSSMDEVLDSLRQADWRWLVLTGVLGFLGIPVSGVTVLGSSPTSLPLGKTMAVQVAAAFTGRTTAAGIGFYGVNIVFLERLGLRRAHAVGVIFLNRAMVGLVTAVLTALGVLVIGSAVPLGGVSVPTGWPVVVGAVVVVAVVAVTVATPWFRDRVWRRGVDLLRELARDLLPTLRDPLRATQLVGGSVLFLVVSAGGLAATLAAFTPDFPVVPVLAVYIVGTTLGQLAPTPGGLGAVEAATVAGLTAIGVDSTPAVAAVLVSRALTFWLPVLPGLVAFRVLQHRGII